MLYRFISMIRESLRFHIVCVLWIMGFGFPALASTLTFTVSMDRPHTHYIQVQMECTGIQAEILDFKMPAWTPGYYKIMDHARHVVNFQAENENGQPFQWYKTAKNTWRVISRGEDYLRIRYEIFAFARSVADSFLDDQRAFLSPTGLFMYPDRSLQHPAEVTIKPYRDFKRISTGLDQVQGQTHTYAAPNFDVLYDCPILVGNQEILSFKVRGIPHTVAIFQSGDFDREKLVAVLKRIVETSVHIVRDIPYKHYTFLFLGEGRGGLEHQNSMAVFTTIPDLDDPKVTRDWLAFITHEFFHLYNVKTIRPIALGPFDYERENYTNMLWFSEGGTVYYQYLILNRAGLISREECLDEFRKSIIGYEGIPGRRFQSAAQSSFDVWMTFLNPTGDSANTTISYYSKGAGLTMLLDLLIRHNSGNTQTLDNVMQALYHTYHKQQQRGFTDLEFRQACETAAGTSLERFFEVYVDTTAPIDYPEILAYAGLEIAVEPNELPGISLGMDTRERDGALIVTRITPGGAAERAGLSIQDEIIALDEQRMDAETLQETLHTAAPDQPLQVLYARHGAVHEIEITPDRNSEADFRIQPMENPTEHQTELLDKWLIQ